MLDFQDAIKKVEIVKEVQTIVLNSERSVVLFCFLRRLDVENNLVINKQIHHATVSLIQLTLET